MSTRKVLLNGNQVLLKDKDYVASGGEGSVWKVGNVAYKIWTDASRATHLAGKIPLLSALKHKSLVVPLGSVSDMDGRVIGMAMPWTEGIALPKMFVNGWRADNGFGLKETERFVVSMKEALDCLHSHGALAPDSNEFNWLADGDCPKLIDADSWQIGGFPATAIMPSIDDPLRGNGFSENSDWFSWGVVTFQLWTGIHPFKGKHPDFKPGDMGARMKAGVSVFDAKVRTPLSTRDYGDIPKNLLEWYESVFSNKTRSAPPKDFRGAALVRKTVRDVSQGKISLSLLREFASDVLCISPSGIVFVKGSGWFDPASGVRFDACETSEIVRGIRGWNAFYVDKGHLCVDVFDNSGRKLESITGDVSCEGVFSNGITVFALLSQGVAPVFVSEKTKDSYAIRVGAVWSAPPSKISVFPGGAVVDAIGKAFVILPKGESVRLVKLPALDGKPILSGRLCGDKARFVTKTGSGVGAISVDFSGSVPVIVDDGDSDGLVVMPSGICVEIPEDGVLRLSSNGKSRELEESVVSEQWKLVPLSSGVGVAVGRKLFKLSVGT